MLMQNRLPPASLKRLLFLVFFILTLSLRFLGAQSQDQSIWFPEKPYSAHSRISIPAKAIRNLPFSTELIRYAPLPRSCPDSLSDRDWLLAYYATTIQQAYQAQWPDRAFLSDSLAPAQLDNFSSPGQAYRLFTSNTRKYDKIKYIRYTLSQGIPVLAGFAQQPNHLQLEGATTWDGRGTVGPYRMLIVGYDSPTASFQLLGPHGPDWGDQGTIWMTRQELLDTVEEILCLQKPKSSQLDNLPEIPNHPISLQLKVSIQQLVPSTGKNKQPNDCVVVFNQQQRAYQVEIAQSDLAPRQYRLLLDLPKGRCTYLFVTHPDGQATPVWKLIYNQKDTTVILPPVSAFQFPDSGRYHLVLLSSYQPIHHWRRYVDRYEYATAPQNASERLYQAFSRFLLPYGKIHYQKDQIEAQTSASNTAEASVLPIVIACQVTPVEEHSP